MQIENDKYSNTIDEKAYLINEVVIFYPKKGLLINIFDRKEATLFTPACRCLLKLILNQGVIVSSRELMREGWELFGQEVTPNTFYQSTLLIRRALSKVMPGTEVIITVKRVGLTIPKEIPISVQHDDLPTEKLDDNIKFHRLHHAFEIFKSLKPGKNFNYIFFLLIATFVFSIITNYYNIKKENSEPEIDYFQNYVKVSSDDKECQILVNPNEGDLNLDKIKISVREIKCKGYPFLYLNEFGSQSPNSVFYCTNPDIEKKFECVTSYILNKDI